MKIRRHREFLIDSMETVKEIEPTKECVAEYFDCLPDRITVEKYGTFDDRIGWDTYIVCVNGNAIGFTDGPLVD
jgi:hypothetical protein